MSDQKPTYIGELAAETGVSVATIRYYERAGIMPPAKRAANGYRIYDDEDVEQLRFVVRTRELDFSLKEIEEILALRERGMAPCAYVMGQIEEKVAEIEARLQALEELREELQQLKAAAAALPAAEIAARSQICHILQNRSLIGLQDFEP